MLQRVGIETLVKAPFAATAHRELRGKNSLTWLVFVVAAIIILAARWLLVVRYGSSLPYWDQWADEAGLLYRSWVGDQFDWNLLWRAHNEHRIVASRVWALLLFAGNQEQWDPMVQALATSGFIALSFAAGLAWCFKVFPGVEFVPVAAGILSIAMLPNGWGNTLVGFQSCFHFVLVFSLLAIICSATSRASFAAIMLIALAFAAASLSLATGLMTFPVIVFVLTIRLSTGSLSLREVLKIAAPLAIIFFGGLYFTPGVESLHAAKAVDWRDFLDSLAIAASWPFSSPSGVLMWLPLVGWLWRTAKTRVATQPDIAIAGVAAWAMLVCIGIAYSRGHQLKLIESRYTDLVAFGVVANSYFAVRYFSLGGYARFRALPIIAAILASAAAVHGLDTRSSSYIFEMTEWSGKTQVASSNVSQFLRGDEDALKDKPQQYIPVPPISADALGTKLLVPEIRKFLPFSLIAPEESQTSDRSRYCRWLSSKESGDTALKPNLACAGTPDNAASVSVGPLSALAFSMWSMLDSRWLNAMTRSDAQITQASTLRCSVETVNDEASAAIEFSVAYSAAVKLSGWIGPRADEPVRLWLTAENGDRYVTQFRSTVPRPDVAAYLEDERLAGSGYRVWIDGSTVPPGTYRVAADVGSSGICETGRAIVFGDAPDPRLAY